MPGEINRRVTNANGVHFWMIQLGFFFFFILSNLLGCLSHELFTKNNEVVIWGFWGEKAFTFHFDAV